MENMTIEELRVYLQYFGYEKGLEGILIDNKFNELLKLAQKMDFNKIINQLLTLDRITLEEVKKDAVSFYKKYFSLSDIKILADYTDYKDVVSKIDMSNEQSIINAYGEYYRRLEDRSPFDLPISLNSEMTTSGSMEGGINKPVILLPRETVPSEIGFYCPFSGIYLSSYLTKLSSSTYIHELAHSQLEKNYGYAESILNKEVITIFLEKISALENDSTGKLLLISERRRIMYMFEQIIKLLNEKKLGCFEKRLSPGERLHCYIYIQSTLLATKLFDLYLQEKKIKKRDRYIYNIQDVFDGKITVEEMLARHDVVFDKCIDSQLVKRHIKMN